jgi:hypothetical protein
MMNTDLMHMLHQQRLQQLRAEAERERAQRDVAGVRTAWAGVRLAAWLRRFSTRGIALTNQSA